MICEFFSQQELCTQGAHTLQAKSVLIEDAANELIDMLLDYEGSKPEEVFNRLEITFIVDIGVM